MSNLTAINDCKTDIKNALESKGVVMTDVKFSEYAGKIRALQIESGDTPAPTPSADYIYTNGYIIPNEGEEPQSHDIIEYVSYEINVDENNEYVINLICPEEIPGYWEGGQGYRDVILTVDIPNTYEMIGLERWDAGIKDHTDEGFKTNPRYSTIVRNGVEYKSYVRRTLDGEDYGSSNVRYDLYEYKITIKKV